jgi:Lamin Tail Domain/Collagen triple helix repeat (20 copies)
VSLVGVAVAAGAATRGEGKIDACRRTKTGLVRIVAADTACVRGEIRMSWGGRGPQGSPGPAGEVGPPGPAGEPGAMGPAGPAGARGATGLAGPAGLPGGRGATGATGQAGMPGLAGLAGMPGARGATGAAGPAGPAGPAGVRGATGAAGSSTNGVRGATGAVGPTGSKGATGAAGAPGPAGPIGPAGPAGPAGQAGPRGQGLTGLGDLSGLPCTRSDGSAGAVGLTVPADGVVEIRCSSQPVPPPPPPAPPPPPPPGAPDLIINEIDYDQVGADGGGFVELANTGTGTAELTGIAVVLVNGDGTEYGRIALTGTLAAGAYLRVDADPQNGAPDGVALVDTATGSLLDALAYEGEIRAAVIGGNTFDLVEGAPLAATVADSNTVNGSLSRLPNRTDTNNAAADWGFTTTPTPGAANVATA